MSDAEQAIRTGPDGGETIRRARELEAVHHAARLQLRDAKSLRLQLLKDELDAHFRALPESDRDLNIALVLGEVPRLWLDLITYVMMEPDPKTYRLWQDRQDGREILAETEDREGMLEHIKRHAAHQAVRRERMLASGGTGCTVPASYSLATVILSCLAGFSFGMLAFVVAAILLEILRF